MWKGPPASREGGEATAGIMLARKLMRYLLSQGAESENFSAWKSF